MRHVPGTHRLRSKHSGAQSCLIPRKEYGAACWRDIMVPRTRATCLRRQTRAQQKKVSRCQRHSVCFVARQILASLICCRLAGTRAVRETRKQFRVRGLPTGLFIVAPSWPADKNTSEGNKWWATSTCTSFRMALRNRTHAWSLGFTQ